MSLNEEVELLRRIALFANIESSKLKLLAFTSERVSYDEGEELFHQGDPGDAAFIIVEGTADVVLDTANGPLKIAQVKRNDIIGEIAILLDIPRTATIVATSALVALRISKDLFFRLVLEFPQMGIEIMRELANRLDRTTTQLRAANSKPSS